MRLLPFALALTVSLTLRRPVPPHGLRIGPGIAAALGVLVLVAVGDLHANDFREALEILWRPFIALASIMLMTGVAARVGTMEQLARVVIPRSGTSASRLFGLVFLLSLATAAVLNNDAAISLLTPMVVVLDPPARPGHAFAGAAVRVRRLHGRRRGAVRDFQPDEHRRGRSGRDRLQRLRRAHGPGRSRRLLVTFLVLRRLFAAELAAAPAAAALGERAPWTPAQRHALDLVLAVLASYPSSPSSACRCSP